MKYIHTLTGLRGLAALIVFISHASNESILPDIWSMGFGQIGVMIFFVLSGFLMSHLYVHENFNSSNIKKYALARIGRVFPLYFSLLIISAIISNYFYSDFIYNFNETDKIVRAFTFIDAPYVFWSIPVEVQFYIIFLGFWYLQKKYSSPYVLIIYIAITMIPTIFLYLVYSDLARIVSLYSYAFFIGALTALFQGRIRNSKKIQKIASFAGFPLVILLFTYTPVIREQYGLVYSESTYLRTWGDPITWAIIYGVFICAILNSRSLVFLNYKPFVYLGSISYGFYLIHYPVLIYFKDTMVNPVLQFSFAFIVTMVLSQASYHYFEKPVGKLIKNIATSKKSDNEL